MGKRTKFQTKETSQLVVLAQSRPRPGWIAKRKSGEKSVPKDEESLDPHAITLGDDTLLEKTAFTSSYATTSVDSPLSSINPSDQPPLHPLDQSVLLGLSLDVKNSSPAHGLTTEQIKAFVSRVLDDAENWSVFSMALLLRSRLEANRSRTVERGLLQMQSLVDQLKLKGTAVENGQSEAKFGPEKGAPAAERLKYAHILAIPTRWQLERELAGFYTSLGMIKSALEIYERLELWEDAVRCLAGSEQAYKAHTLIKDLLEGRKTDSEIRMKESRGQNTLDNTRQANLWCLLGDIERDDSHYRKAWEVSNHRSARAMRSLGGRFYKLGNFKEAQEALRKSVENKSHFRAIMVPFRLCSVANRRLAGRRRSFQSMYHP